MATYYWQIIAFDASDNPSQFRYNVRSFSTHYSTIAHTDSPGLITSDQTFDLEWYTYDHIANVNNFRLLIDTEYTFTTPFAADIPTSAADGNGIMFGTYTTLTLPEDIYYWTVCWVDETGYTSTDYSIYWTVELDTTAPLITGEPTGFTYLESETGTYQLTWNWNDQLSNLDLSTISLFRKLDGEQDYTEISSVLWKDFNPTPVIPDFIYTFDIDKSTDLLGSNFYKIKLTDYFDRETWSSEIEIIKNDAPTKTPSDLPTRLIAEGETYNFGIIVHDSVISGGNWEIRYSGGGTVLYGGTWADGVTLVDQTIHASDLLFFINNLEFWAEDSSGASLIDDFIVIYDPHPYFTDEPTGFSYLDSESGIFQLDWTWYDEVTDYAQATMFLYRKLPGESQFTLQNWEFWSDVNPTWPDPSDFTYSLSLDKSTQPLGSSFYYLKIVDTLGGYEIFSDTVEIIKNDVPTTTSDTPINNRQLDEGETLNFGIKVWDTVFPGGNWEIRYSGGGDVLHFGTWSNGVTLADQTISASELLFQNNDLEFWAEDSDGASLVVEFTVIYNWDPYFTSEPTGFTYLGSETGLFQLDWTWYDNGFDMTEATMFLYRKLPGESQFTLQNWEFWSDVNPTWPDPSDFTYSLSLDKSTEPVGSSFYYMKIIEGLGEDEIFSATVEIIKISLLWSDNFDDQDTHPRTTTNDPIGIPDDWINHEDLPSSHNRFRVVDPNAGIPGTMATTEHLEVTDSQSQSISRATRDFPGATPKGYMTVDIYVLGEGYLDAWDKDAYIDFESSLGTDLFNIRIYASAYEDAFHIEISGSTTTVQLSGTFDWLTVYSLKVEWDGTSAGVSIDSGSVASVGRSIGLVDRITVRTDDMWASRFDNFLLYDTFIEKSNYYPENHDIVTGSLAGGGYAQLEDADGNYMSFQNYDAPGPPLLYSVQVNFYLETHTALNEITIVVSYPTSYSIMIDFNSGTDYYSGPVSGTVTIPCNGRTILKITIVGLPYTFSDQLKIDQIKATP